MACHRPSPSHGLSPVCDYSLSPGTSLAIKILAVKIWLIQHSLSPSVPLELSGGSQDAMWMQVTFTESPMGEGPSMPLEKESNS